MQARCEQEKREMGARHERAIREMQEKVDREREIQREMAEKHEASMEEQRRLRREMEIERDSVIEAKDQIYQQERENKRAVEVELSQRMVR